MRIYRRFVEIVHLLGGYSFFYTTLQADLENPTERSYIDKYLRGRPGIATEEHIRLFKLAWDVTGSAFAQRVTQYVTCYSGDPIRLTLYFLRVYPQSPEPRSQALSALALLFGALALLFTLLHEFHIGGKALAIRPVEL
jgi:aromatic ring hydroxylase